MAEAAPGEIQAAGAVLWRARAGGTETALVHRPRYDDWSFPKGKLHAGEEEAHAALREVEEEAGLRCRLGRELGVTSYHDSRGRPKTVRYWEMTPDGGEPAAAHEVDDARWVRSADVPALLSYDRDRELFERFRTLLARRSTETRPLYVVRHAEAGNRKRWSGPDEARPLSAEGRGQAEALVGRFAGLPLSRLLSSPYVRCVQTLELLGQARDLPIDVSDALAEGARLEEVLSLVQEVAGTGDAVLSTHGDVIELLLGHLGSSRVPLVAPGRIELAKGSTWVLEATPDGDVVEGRYAPPP